MDPNMFWALVALAAALGIGVLAFVIWRTRSRHHSEDLHRRFGPEYDRLLESGTSKAKADRELTKRLHRMNRVKLRDLSVESHARYAAAWQATQARFVDDPSGAVLQADGLIHEIMREIGYPIARDLEEQVSDLSVHHANVVQHYRAARALAEGVDQGRAGTEDLRQAIVHYRVLFAHLLNAPVPRAATAIRQVPA